MDGHHDVLVATSRTWGESPCVVREELVDGDADDFRAVGAVGGVEQRFRCCNTGNLSRGADVLSWLGGVPPKRFVC